MRGINLLTTLLLSFACGRASADTVLLSAFGGAEPGGTSPGLYQAYPSSPLNTAALTDHDAATGVTLFGTDAFRQSNGAIVDTAAFAVFRFHVDPDVTALRFSVLGEMQLPGPFNGIYLHVLRPGDTAFSELILDAPTPGPTNVSVTFDATGNSGSFSLFKGLRLQDVLDVNHNVTFAVTGGPDAQLNQTGVPTLKLYEVSAAAVPLPGVVPMASICIGLGLLRRRRPQPCA